MIKNDENKGKKTYQTPKLSVFGDIKKITKNVGRVSATADGGVGQTSKTL